jgi:hypothetical protein
MKYVSALATAALVASIFGLHACATGGSPDTMTAAFAAATSEDPSVRQTAATPAADGKKPVWSVPSEKEVAATLEKKYLDATTDFVKLKKNDEIVFCKRYREIGSSIARINCLTAAEVRTQVDNMTQYRDDMRNKGSKCTRGRAGGPPCGA